MKAEKGKNLARKKQKKGTKAKLFLEKNIY